jgi:hypothetical protein
VRGWRRETGGKCVEWQAGAWKFGFTLCPGTWAVLILWDGNPMVWPLCFRRALLVRMQGGKYWPWDWTILRVVAGKQEFRVDLALNYWSVGVDLVKTDDWSIHLGPLDIECEYDKFYDLDDAWIGRPIFDYSRRYANRASVSVIPKVRRGDVPQNQSGATHVDPSDAGPAG